MNERVDPVWLRHQNYDGIFCNVTIDLGGSGFSARAEITGKEEMEANDLEQLKKIRIRHAYLSVRTLCEEWFNG